MKAKLLKNCSIIATALFTMLMVSSAHAVKPVYIGGKERAAIRGYDPVAFFVDGEPVKGLKEFTLEHEGAKWMFANQQNLDAFKASPDYYMPQYGGYCAYAVANGSTASIKPQFFTIHEDKLYLNFSKSVYKKWLKDKDGYISEGNKEWPRILEK